MRSEPASRRRRWRFQELFSLLAVAALSLVTPPTVDASGKTLRGQAMPPARLSAQSQGATAYVLPGALPYGDCSGATPLGPASIYRDTCVPGIYLMAHNPGPFTSILSLKVGSRVSYAGRTFTIASAALRSRQAQWRQAHAHPAALTLQTCANDSRSLLWVLTAS